MASAVVKMENIQTHVAAMAMMIASAVTGLLVHIFIVLPLLFWLFTKKNPFKFMKGVIKALVTAFATSSR